MCPPLLRYATNCNAVGGSDRFFPVRQAEATDVFDKLIESNPKARAGGKFGGSTTLSIVIHGLLAYAAIQATIGSGMRSSDDKLDTTMVFVQPEKEKEQEKQPEVKLEEPK